MGNMTTPRDVARMLRSFSVPSQQIRPLETTIGEREGDRAGRLEKAVRTPGHLPSAHLPSAHLSSSPHTSAHPAHPTPSASARTAHSARPTQPSSAADGTAHPTPADMPKKKLDSLSAETFASLDGNELPVSREYSAGGLIFNSRNEVALIARHSRSGHLEWCLPKGHIEKGETPEQTAIREVHEETGILGTVTGSIATIDYWFTGDEQRVHKLVHHYVLRQVSGHLTVAGDPDHEAEDAAWVPFDRLTSVLSYPNERRIVWLYMRKFDHQR